MRDKEQWVRKKLGDSNVAKIIMGQSPSSAAYNEEGVGLPFLQGCAEFGDIYPNTSIFCSDLLKIAPENSILMSVRAPVGAINKADKKYVIGRGLCSIIPIIDGGYLYYYLFQNTHELELKAQGSTFLAINSTELKDMPICYPDSLPAQRRIAAILSAVDKVIEQTRQLISKYKSIKQGMMEDLLKPKEGWKKVKFDVFFDMLPTNTLSRDKLNNQQGVYQNIHYGDVLIKYPYCMSCDENEIPYINEGIKFNIVEIKDGDVIFADTAEDDTVGKCIEVLDVRNRKIVSGLHTYFCRPSFEMELGYLGYFLNSNHFHNQLLPYIAGSKVSSVNRTSISRTSIFYPDPPEQRRIVKVLSGIDRKIEVEEKVLEKYEKMKKGLMERMLNK